MMQPVPMAELWRGGILESQHLGHAVVCDAHGEVVLAWGDPAAVIFPRSSCKMIQALPLLESGAAEAAGLSDAQLALACASHQGAAIHTVPVAAWLSDLGLAEQDLRCGAHVPNDPDARAQLIKSDSSPCQLHNNCSGKHAGFLTLNKHLGTGSEYTELDHPIQKMILSAFEQVTEETSPGHGIDGCSAPNFATSVHGLARAMATFATAHTRSDRRSRAAERLVDAMRAWPELVAGESRACTELMRAMDGRVAIKTGAEAVFVAIIPELQMGVALKISDGSTRAAECAVAAILVKLGVLDAAHPATQKRMNTEISSHRGLHAGWFRPAAVLA
jgi:L-asparaginase II